MLSEYLEEHKGELIKLGAATGFLYIGYIDDGIKRTLGKIAWESKPRIPSLLTREVIETYPSIFDGTIVLIEGAERGEYWTKGEYDFFNHRDSADKRNNGISGNLRFVRGEDE